MSVLVVLVGSLKYSSLSSNCSAVLHLFNSCAEFNGLAKEVDVSKQTFNSLPRPTHQLVAGHKKGQTANSGRAPPYPPRWAMCIPARTPVTVLPSGKHLTVLLDPAQMPSGKPYVTSPPSHTRGFTRVLFSFTCFINDS